MSKFTPGKWETGILPRLGHIAVFSRGVAVADCFSNRANARLIAIAPEMYERLKEVFCGPISFTEIIRMGDAVRELLARIDGEEAKA